MGQHGGPHARVLIVTPALFPDFALGIDVCHIREHTFFMPANIIDGRTLALGAPQPVARDRFTRALEATRLRERLSVADIRALALEAVPDALWAIYEAMLDMDATSGARRKAAVDMIAVAGAAGHASDQRVPMVLPEIVQIVMNSSDIELLVRLRGARERVRELLGDEGLLIEGLVEPIV